MDGSRPRPNRDRETAGRRRSRRCAVGVSPLEGRTLMTVTSVTEAVTPNVLWPPSGQYRLVTVSGDINQTVNVTHAKTNPVPDAPRVGLKVTDEYRLDEPRTPVTLRRTSLNFVTIPVTVDHITVPQTYAQAVYHYSVSFHLQPKRSLDVPDGRHYDLAIGATDDDNGLGKTVPVVVPLRPFSTPRPGHFASKAVKKGHV
jgi:hypothetical protein